VVDHEGKLMGVIRYNTLISAAQEEALEGFQAMVGVSRDEKALSTAWFAVRKRLPWLQINLLTAFLAASVVGLFEDTIAKVTALAVLLPVVAGQSGNTGAQALAVAIRGLTIKEIRVSQWMRLVRKELTAGFVNGCAVALVTAVGVWVWSRSLGLVMVISCSMVISMVIAGGAGAAVPMVLKAFKQDPAQSSSIILTTVTDVVGFFSFLGIATVFMSLLPQG
jgi:magnesium transporter